jgi:hypothetical protein
MTLSRDLADVENSVPCGRIKPLFLAVVSLRPPSEDLADDEEDAVEEVDAILLNGGAENPWNGGVVGGVLVIFGVEAIVGEVEDFVGVVRGDETGVWPTDDIPSGYLQTTAQNRRGSE